MTAPERRRPLPALAFIGALCLLTAIVWFRVIHRSDSAAPPTSSTCPSGATTRTAPVTVVPHERKVSVLVLNSTNRKGIAADTKKALTKRGFKVVDARNDSPTYGGHGSIRGVAEIRYGPSALPAATLVHLYFPHSVLKATDASSRTVSVALGAKFRSLASARTVHKALRAHHLHYGKVKPRPQPSTSC